MHLKLHKHLFNNDAKIIKKILENIFVIKVETLLSVMILSNYKNKIFKQYDHSELKSFYSINSFNRECQQGRLLPYLLQQYHN
jgi:hypothetical protein